MVIVSRPFYAHKVTSNVLVYLAVYQAPASDAEARCAVPEVIGPVGIQHEQRSQPGRRPSTPLGCPNAITPVTLAVVIDHHAKSSIVMTGVVVRDGMFQNEVQQTMSGILEDCGAAYATHLTPTRLSRLLHLDRDNGRIDLRLELCVLGALDGRELLVGVVDLNDLSGLLGLGRLHERLGGFVGHLVLSLHVCCVARAARRAVTAGVMTFFSCTAADRSRPKKSSQLDFLYRWPGRSK